ncbi:MAG: PKD domain-containing protein [Candidatus Bathyarchaeia archaeon]
MQNKLVVTIMLLTVFAYFIFLVFGAEPEMWASCVVDYHQGLRKDGTPVLPERSNPNNALGEPDDLFFSLGFGGWIIVGFPYPIANRAGDDVLVIETTWGTYPLEKADVYVSRDGTEWVYAGTVDNKGNKEVPIPTGLTWVNYVKIVDTTDPTPFEPTADGFDVNAVGAFYALTEVYLEITVTVGGTTQPNPGTYIYSFGTNVSVSAIPGSGYYFDHWELDGVNVGDTNPFTVLMNDNHTLHAVFIPALSVSISPLSSTIFVGESVEFTSEVTGGTPPYTYQWYVNDAPVSGANSDSWVFTPTTSGLYYIYLKVTDAKGHIAQSAIARIEVISLPVGGYSTSLYVNIREESLLYSLAVVTLALALIMFKRAQK